MNLDIDKLKDYELLIGKPYIYWTDYEKGNFLLASINLNQDFFDGASYNELDMRIELLKMHGFKVGYENVFLKEDLVEIGIYKEIIMYNENNGMIYFSEAKRNEDQVTIFRSNLMFEISNYTYWSFKKSDYFCKQGFYRCNGIREDCVGVRIWFATEEQILSALSEESFIFNNPWKVSLCYDEILNSSGIAGTSENIKLLTKKKIKKLSSEAQKILCKAHI